MPNDPTIFAVVFAGVALLALGHFLYQRREKRRARGSRWATWRDEPWNHPRRRSSHDIRGPD